VKSFGNKILLITDEKEKEATKIKLAEIKDFIEGLLKKLL